MISWRALVSVASISCRVVRMHPRMKGGDSLIGRATSMSSPFITTNIHSHFPNIYFLAPTEAAPDRVQVHWQELLVWQPWQCYWKKNVWSAHLFKQHLTCHHSNLRIWPKFLVQTVSSCPFTKQHQRKSHHKVHTPRMYQKHRLFTRILHTRWLNQSPIHIHVRNWHS